MATEFISNSWLMPTNANAEANRVSNYSLDFDGSQYIDLGTSVDLGTNSTISLWFKSSSGNANNLLLGESSYSFTDFLMIESATNKLNVRLGTGGGAVNTFTGLTEINDSNWNHWVIVRNGNSVELFINNTSKGSLTYTGTLLNTKFNVIGARGNGGFPINGQITEISGFNYALSASQVTELYGTGSAIGNPMAITNGRKPVAYYPLSNSAFNGEFLVPNGAEQDFVFDFSSSKITINNNFDSIIATTNFTLSAWINLNSLGASQLKFIFTNESLQFTITDKITTYLRGASGYFLNPFNSNTTLSTGKWYNVVLVKSGSDYTYYLNSSQDGTVNNSTSVNNSSQTTSTIGTYYNNNQYYFDGKLSNLSIFNTALPATGTESVASLYNYGTPPNIASWSNLQAWWELDASATFDGSNWSIPDASSNSNTGTSSGMTASNLVQSDLIINQSYDPFSLSFDGTDDRVGFTSSIDLGTINTISLWLKNEVSQDRIFLGEDSYPIDYHILGGYNHFIVRVGGSYNVLSTGTVPIIPIASNWSHVVFIRNGDDVSLYINGYLSASSNTWTGGSPSSNASKFDSIGAKPTGGTSWLGKISNVSAFNSELSATQVKTLYNEGKPFNLNNFAVTPVSWWRLGAVNSSFDGSNWTVLDEIGTNNGTSANMTQSDLVSGVGATGSGTSSGMGSGENRIGSAPFSENNAVSYNMSVTAKSTSVPT